MSLVFETENVLAQVGHESLINISKAQLIYAKILSIHSFENK